MKTLRLCNLLLLVSFLANSARAAVGDITTVAIAGGDSTAIALRSDGTVWSWGTNDVGEMGVPAATANMAFPVRIAGLTNVVSIASGFYHGLALESNGTVWSWGNGIRGQLGNGQTTNCFAPVMVPGLSNVVRIGAGARTSYAVLSNGQVYGWGWNGDGEVGDGTTVNRSSPVLVSGLTNPASIGGGYYQAAAVLTNGDVWCWGKGSYGVVGTGSNNTVFTTPVHVTGISNVTSLHCGLDFDLALRKDGTVWSWGQNAYGQLGLGVAGPAYVPTQITALSGVQTIGVGEESGAAVVSNSPTGYAWGYYDFAFLPYPLEPGPAFSQLTGGAYYSLGMGADGSVWGWGQNNGGNFGDGNLNTASEFQEFPTRSFGPFPYSQYGLMVRGDQSDDSAINFNSIVVPIDLEDGVSFNPSGSDFYDFTNTIPWFLAVQKAPVLAPLDLTTGTNLSRFSVENPQVAFGSQGGGTALYPNKPYRFGVFAGGFDESTASATNVIKISVYTATNFTSGTTNVAPLNTYTISLPRRTIPADSNAWYGFMTNGGSVTVTSNGLTTTVEFLDEGNTNDEAFYLYWKFPVMTNYIYTGYKLTHVASSTNYFYRVDVLGKVQVGNNTLAPFATNSAGTWTPIPMYTLDFTQPNPLESSYLSQLFFNGTPMPPNYEDTNSTTPNGASLPVTNQLSLTSSAYTNINNSPELRRHPTLDQFVLDMNKDPLALASYVINEIDLTDPVATSPYTPTLQPTITCGGIDRSALGTFLEGQGSPIEQCALLVYLLRQAGYPAAYVFPTNNNLLMTDTHISQLWRTQVKGVVYRWGFDLPIFTNSLLTVNYPWVAVNIGTNTYHIFPWIKDTEIVEGVNLYDYLPTNYNTGLKWVENYVRNDPNIMSLDSENVVSRLFPAFVQQYLNPQDPTFSLDNLGVRAFNRRHQYPQWTYLPQPDGVTNLSTLSVVDNLADTNNFKFLTNVFNTARVQVYNGTVATTNLLLDTTNWNACDLHDRKLLLFTNNGRLCLWMAPYSSNVTGIQSFTNANLTYLQSNSVPTNSIGQIAVQMIHHRQYGTLSHWYQIFPLTESTGITNLTHCKLGDVAGIALDYGRVTRQMLQQHAETYYGLERQRAANTNFVPQTWDYAGTAAYLLGMGYFQKVDAFDARLMQWEKLQGLIHFGSGLGVIGITGNATNMQGKVDMVQIGEITVGNGSIRPDNAVPDFTEIADFYTLGGAAGSSQEHDILQTMFPDQNAVSTVRLLQLAQARATNGNSPILELVNNSYAAAGNQSYSGYGTTLLKNQDSGIWASISNAFAQGTGVYARALVTPGSITNAPKTYIGMGALVLAPGFSLSAISANMAVLNGGYGSEEPGYPPPTTPSSYLGYQLGQDPNDPNGLTMTPNNGQAVEPAVDPITEAQANSGSSGVAWTTQQGNQAAQTQYVDNQSGSVGAGIEAGGDGGSIGQTDGGGQSSGQTILEPVNITSGAFYVDTTDLSLPGPFPLQLRRNYSSQNLQCNEFGYGWKMNFNPFLVLTTNGSGQSVIYGAELDGTVIAYRATNGVWQVLPQDNPSLNNNSVYGVGSTANLFNSVLKTNANGYTVYAADGSVRTYQIMSFPVTSGTSTMNRTRPYLTQWQDHAGNYALFYYGTNSGADDYGQVNRINMANGNTLVLKYDFYGRIIQAISGDGRFVNYEYDNYGDLITVTLPDASQCQYQYQHYTYTTNGANYTDSTHLVSQEIKPSGRIVANTYDALRRVTIQASTVGTNLVLTTNGWFYYTNNMTSLTNQLVSGLTRVEDVFHNPTVYYYTNNLITNTVDPVNRSTKQIWFSDTVTNVPGYYPRSLQYTIDARGLTNQFYYDSRGNITNAMLLGNITGEGNFNQNSASTATFTNNNVPLSVIDSSGNGSQFTYDSGDPFRVVKSVRVSGSTPVATNYFYYTNVAQTSSIGTTNYAYGLVARRVIAGATNDYTYNGSGFLTKQIQYAATSDLPSDGDPPVTTQFSYNARGQLYQQQVVGGGLTQTDYDPMGRITSRLIFDPNNNNLSHEYFYYDRNGELEWYDGPRSNPEDYVYYVHDAAGRVIQQIKWRSQGMANGAGVEAPDGYNQYGTTFQTFDGFGNLTSVIDARGVITTNLYDSVGRLYQRQVIDANGTTLKTETFAYEAGNQIALATNAFGGVTTNLYTQTGKPYIQLLPDGSSNGWSYYLDGRPKRQYLANGSYWQTAYDDVNLWATRTFYTASGSPLETNRAGFDRRGNQTLTVDANGNSFTNFYDGLNRVKFTAGPFAMTVTTNLPGVGGGGSSQTNLYYQSTTNYYDSAGLAVTNFNALGESDITLFDVLGRAIDREIHDSGNNLVRITTTTYSTDHQSSTVTQGSGTTAVSTTTYTDNAGQPVLIVSYPSTGTLEFILRRYDLVENLISETHNSASSGNATQWTTSAYVVDGLNRVISKTDRDGALSTYAYNPAGNLTNAVMPGGLVWRAAYNPALQKTYDCDVGSGGVITRSNHFSYYSTTGLLQTTTDGRGVSCAHYYDSFLRPITNAYTGSLPEHNMTTAFGYDPRGILTNVIETFASTNTGPNTQVSRFFDTYGLLTSDATSDGAFSYTAGMGHDFAGRRTGVGFSGLFGYGYSWRADGLLASMNSGMGSASYAYDTGGFLLSRSLSPKFVSIGQRDGAGRPVSITNTVNGVSSLVENMTYTGDGLLASHTVVRPDFTDSRSYTYAAQSRRLVQEILGLSASAKWTNVFTYDNGSAGGPGVLTSTTQAPGATNVAWRGGEDAFSRIGSQTNTVAEREAYGQVNGRATVSGLLDGDSIPVTSTGTNAQQWRAVLELLPGAHQLIMSALHPSMAYTARATNTFTNNAADRVAQTYSGNGDVTNRVWISSNGTTNATESLTFDARDRLHGVTYLDSTQSGYVWTAIYDGLGRRLQTVMTIVSNGVNIASQPKVINEYYDSEIDGLELGETDNGVTTWKVYGPDVNGIYGGMSGIGGLEAVVVGAQQAAAIVSDFRGNGYAVYNLTSSALNWYAARPSAYGAVPGYRPAPLGDGAELAQSSASWGKWPDSTGFYHFGRRDYDPIAGNWLSGDSLGHASDPALNTFCLSDPVNYIDATGQQGKPANQDNTGLPPVAQGSWVIDPNTGAPTWLSARESFSQNLAAVVANATGGTADSFSLAQTAADTFLNYSAIQQDAALYKGSDFGTGWGAAVGTTATIKLGADVAGATFNVITLGDAAYVKKAIQAGIDGIQNLLYHDATEVEAAILKPYGGPGGGHHVPAQSAFIGDPAYNPNTALAIPNAELANQGVNHYLVTGAQQTLYRAYAQTGQTLTWDTIQAIETQALVAGGMNQATAQATVTEAINALKEAGVTGPTRIPWGGK